MHNAAIGFLCLIPYCARGGAPTVARAGAQSRTPPLRSKTARHCVTARVILEAFSLGLFATVSYRRTRPLLHEPPAALEAQASGLHTPLRVTPPQKNERRAGPPSGDIAAAGPAAVRADLDPQRPAGASGRHMPGHAKVGWQCPAAAAILVWCGGCRQKRPRRIASIDVSARRGSTSYS